MGMGVWDLTAEAALLRQVPLHFSFNCMKFSRDGRFFYILGEIDGSVTTCAYDATRGKVKCG